MMTNGFNAWRAANSLSPAGENRRAIGAWKIIQRNATSITLWRGDTPLSPQTVHVSHDPSASVLGDVSSGEINESYERGVTVFGVKGHPTVSDTDIQTGDEFELNGESYRITDVVFYTGSIQARGYKITT